MSEKEKDDQTEHTVEGQAREQAGKQVKVGVDERTMDMTYANGFRTNGTAEEVMIDFGLNLMNPGRQQDENQPDVIFKVEERIILNYYSAKRLAITLSQLIRRHEDQFGELELDVAKRRMDNL